MLLHIIATYAFALIRDPHHATKKKKKKITKKAVFMITPITDAQLNTWSVPPTIFRDWNTFDAWIYISPIYINVENGEQGSSLFSSNSYRCYPSGRLAMVTNCIRGASYPDLWFHSMNLHLSIMCSYII